MSKLTEIFTHLFTARNGVDYSLTKLFGITAASSLTYNFIHSASSDFTGYGIAMTGVMAAMAAKYMVEEK